MTEKMANILVVDDDENICQKINSYLKKRNLSSIFATNSSKALDEFKKNNIDICFLDVILPGENGIELLKSMKILKPQVEIILMSGFGNMDIVIQALRNGAIDFIKKPFHFHDLDFALARTKRYLELQNKLEKFENHYSLISRELEGQIEKEMIGISPQIKKTLELAMLAGKDGDINVLITGENGTGKEIIARIIHYTGSRKEHSFFPVNSTAIPESLLESEFFGHRKGSFTDAREDKKGFFELANKGTLFLDEIADMPLNLQAKLLRAIEENTVRPIGFDRLVDVDTRIISATNKNILQLVSENKFREDLFHRINAFTVHIPPLRERTVDIEPLIKHFSEYFAKRKNRPAPQIDPDLIKKLQNYSFPGNVRELKNMVERALLVSDYQSLNSLNTLGNGVSPNSKINKTASTFNLNHNEKKIIERALNYTSFNQVKAAQLLGISRDALIRRLHKHNIKINHTMEEN